MCLHSSPRTFKIAAQLSEGGQAAGHENRRISDPWRGFVEGAAQHRVDVQYHDIYIYIKKNMTEMHFSLSLGLAAREEASEVGGRGRLLLKTEESGLIQ